MLLALCGVLGLTTPGPGDMTLLCGLGTVGSDRDGTETAFCSCPLGLDTRLAFPTFRLLSSSKSRGINKNDNKHVKRSGICLC